MPTPGPPTGPVSVSAPEVEATTGSLDTSAADEATELGSLVAGEAPLARRSPPLQPGVALGRYVLGRRLGAGSMGAVYEAHDTIADRPVALKVLHEELPERARQRMKLEARILARFSHPNIVEVFEVVHSPDRTFLVMELVRGQTLAHWRTQDPAPSWQEAVRAYLQAGAGLAAAHAAGFLHRDFKPGNCIVGEDGRVRVLDFGVATAIGGEDLASIMPTDATPTDDVAVASTLGVAGTPAYMAPEQALGEPCDARTDQYGFCASLYEAVYGERPIVADSLPSLMRALDRGEIRPAPVGHRVPPALRRALIRGLDRDPAKRWPSMDALLGALRRTVEPRRRWRVPLVLAGALVPAVGAWLWWSGAWPWRNGEVDPRCNEAAPLRGVWDDARREQLEAAVLATGVPYAATAWARIEHDLDEYAAGWTLERAALCEAARSETAAEATDLRLQCLDDQRKALHETVELFAAASATRVEKAVPLLADLPALTRCDDVETLRIELQQPGDPEDATHVADVRERLWRAERLTVAGEYDDAARILDEAAAEADALGHPPLQAEAARVRGGLDTERGRFVEAATQLEQAYLLAVESGLDGVATASALDLAFVLAEQSRLDEALRWARAGLLRTQGTPPSPLPEALALRIIGNILRRRGELDEAIEPQRRALAIYEDQTRLDLAALAMEDLSQTLLAKHDLVGALEHEQRALALIEQALGPAHPHAGTAHTNLATVLTAQGDLDGASEQLRRALAIFEGAHGLDHPHVGAAWANLAEVLRQQGRLDESRESFERALACFEVVYGPSHPETAKVVASIASVLAAQGRYDAAIEHQRRALTSLEEAYGPKHTMVAALLNNMGGVLHRQGKSDEALACFRRAAEIFEQALGPDHPSLAGALSNVATELAARGEPSEARVAMERALAIKERQLGPRHPDVVVLLGRVTELALEQQDLPAVRVLARRVAAIQDASDLPPELHASVRSLLERAEAFIAAAPQ